MSRTLLICVCLCLLVAGSAFGDGNPGSSPDGPSRCCIFRGDVDYDGEGPNIADLVYLALYMFQQGPAPPCLETANIDGGFDGQITIIDLVYLAVYMFQEGDTPPPCF